MKITKTDMKKLMSNDIFLRILSLVLAILFWIYIVFITNPEIEVKITGIPITLANHQSIKNEGYIVSNEITTTVDIKVKGTRRMLADMDRDSIIAYVDLTDCTDKKTYELPVSIKLPYEDISLVSSSVIKLPVAVDNYITKEYAIESNYSGELKNSNYSIHKLEHTKTVTVSGPEPIVNTIDSATITIDLKGASDDLSGYAHVKLLNSNDAEVVSNTLDIKNKDASYKCTIYQKKNVAIKPKINNSNSYECTVLDHPTVTVIGPSSDVDGLTSIPTKLIQGTEYDSSVIYIAQLLIPENMSIEEEIRDVEVMVTKK